VRQCLAQAQGASLAPDFGDIGDNCGHPRLPNTDTKRDQPEVMESEALPDDLLENVLITHSDPQNVVCTVRLQGIFHRRDLRLKGVRVRVDICKTKATSLISTRTRSDLTVIRTDRNVYAHIDLGILNGLQDEGRLITIGSVQTKTSGNLGKNLDIPCDVGLSSSATTFITSVSKS
jgi:hypothetical protein